MIGIHYSATDLAIEFNKRTYSIPINIVHGNIADYLKGWPN